MLRRPIIMEMLEEENDEKRRKLRITRKCLRDHHDAFDIYDIEFIQQYRMPKHLAMILLEKISPFMMETSISKSNKMLLSIAFLAEGTFQKKIGVNYLHCVSQSVVSRAITEFCEIVNSKLMPELIRFPQTTAEMTEIKIGFFNKFGFPGVIGCVDGTHVSMFRPNERIEHVYLNRHQYHSKNVQLICDSNLKILNINARYGGSNHDASIWRKSLVKGFLYNKQLANEIQNTYLLGDSGYPLEPWLMNPILHPTNASEEKYNVIHRRTRNCIERLNGVLKSRFRSIGKDRCLKYSPQKMGLIINTCATLHNFLKIQNYVDNFDDETHDDELTLPEVEPDPTMDDDDEAIDQNDNNLLLIARQIRQSICNEYFNEH